MKWLLISVLLLSVFSAGALAHPVEEEPACNPYIFIYLNCHSQYHYFSLGLVWGGYCQGPPEIRHGIQVKSWQWETYVESGTLWNNPHAEYVQFELSCLYTLIKVDASIECGCGNGNSATETKSYSKGPLFLMPPLWLSNFWWPVVK